MTEQGYQIKDVTWLKKKDKLLGNFASLVIWFDAARGAEWTTDNGHHSTRTSILTPLPDVMLFPEKLLVISSQNRR